MIGLGAMEMLFLLFFGGPFGLPVSLPPLPKDPVMLGAAPPECLWYMSLAGMAKPDPASRNHTEQLLAEAEVQRFFSELEKRLLARIKKTTPPEQARAIDEGVRLAKTLITRPVTAFVASVDPAQANMQGGAIVSLGADKAAVLQSIAFFEGLAGAPPAEGRWKGIPFPAPFPIEWGTEGDYLILGVGAGAAEAIAGRVAKPGPTPGWLTSLEKELALERAGQLHYFNVKKIVALALADARPQVRTILDALGISQIKHIAAGVGLDAGGMVSRTCLSLEGAPRGIFAPLAGPPLTAADLEPIPADSTLALALRLDGAQVLAAIREISGQISPESREEFDAKIGQMEDQLGFKLRDELLQPLGDVWRLYNSPSEGGLVFTGLTAVVSLRDREKFVKTHDRLVSMVRGANPPDESGRRRRGSATINEFAAGAHKGYLLTVSDDDMLFSPAWCVTDKELVVSLFPQGVQAYVGRTAAATGAKPASLAANPAVARLPAQGAVAVAWHDVPATFRLLYPALQMFGTAITGELQREGFDLDVSLLPSAQVIQRHLSPDASAILRTADGFVIESRGTSPISGSLGMLAPAAIYLLAEFRGPRVFSRLSHDLSVIADPSLQTVNNLKQIGLAMHNYESVYHKLPTSYNKEGKPQLSWRVHVLPFLEQQALYNQFKLDEPWDSPHNKKLISIMPEIYKAPGSKAAADFKTVYLVPSGKETIFPPGGEASIRLIRDGTSNTLMCIEASDDRAVVWTRPDDLEINLDKPLTGLLIRSGSFVALFGDGSVQRLSAKLPVATLRALFTRAGGEPVSLPNEAR